MAKRFTDTEKWKKGWFLSLTLAEKVFWNYLCDSCTHAGIWDVSWKSAEFHVGVKLNQAKIRETFKKQFIELDGGKRWFIADFITFQYKRLNPNNPAHKGAIEELQKYSLINDDYSISIPCLSLVGASESLTSPSEGTKDKDKDMDMVKDRDKEKDKEKSEIGFNKKEQQEKFVSIWPLYPRREGKKEAFRHFCATVTNEAGYLILCSALDNYKAHLKKNHTEAKFIKMGSTWFNQWDDWVTENRKLKNIDVVKYICSECGKQHAIGDLCPTLDEISKDADPNLLKKVFEAMRA